MKHPLAYAALALAVSISTPALAYVGPGAGLSLLGALWALLLAVGAALLFLVAWPVRRMRRRRQEQATATGPDSAVTAGQSPDTGR